MALREPLAAEGPLLLAIGEATGLFAPGEVDALLGATLDSWHAGRLNAGHCVKVATVNVATVANAVEDPALGWAYWGPDEEEPGTWELYWIGVSASARRAGVGMSLLKGFEAAASQAGAAKLRIATSSLPSTAAARLFYARAGYSQARVDADYYGAGDDKVVFEKEVKVQ